MIPSEASPSVVGNCDAGFVPGFLISRWSLSAETGTG